MVCGWNAGARSSANALQREPSRAAPCVAMQNNATFTYLRVKVVVANRTGAHLPGEFRQQRTPRLHGSVDFRPLAESYNALWALAKPHNSRTAGRRGNSTPHFAHCASHELVQSFVVGHHLHWLECAHGQDAAAQKVFLGSPLVLAPAACLRHLYAKKGSRVRLLCMVRFSIFEISTSAFPAVHCEHGTHQATSGKRSTTERNSCVVARGNSRVLAPAVARSETGVGASGGPK